jgi:MoaA/NifB/PqqE/SkfB family radical SAM enzyme
MVNRYDITSLQSCEAIKAFPENYLQVFRKVVPYPCMDIKSGLKDPLILLGILHGSKAFTGPRTITIDPINTCDLGCVMCGYHSPLIPTQRPQQWQQRMMPLHLFSQVVDDAVSMAVKKIVICGAGEPFLHPDLPEMMRLVKGKGLYLILFTNGIHLTPEDLHLLIDLKVDTLIVSLHAGDPLTYRSVHPNTDEMVFSKIQELLIELAHLKLTYKTPVPQIAIINVITKRNYMGVNKMLGFAERIGADMVTFKIADLDQDWQGQLRLDPTELERLISALYQVRVPPTLKTNISRFIPSLLRRSLCPSPLTNPRDRGPYGLCYVPWTNSTITTEGDVLGCVYNPKVLGNITSSSFKEIWYSKGYARYRARLDCMPCSASATYHPILNLLQRVALAGKRR